MSAVLLQAIVASSSQGGNRSIIFPSPGSNSPPNTLGTSYVSQGTPFDPGGYADSVPSPSTSGFIRRGYAGYWSNQGSYNDDNPSIFNGTILETQSNDNYIAFGSQDNSETFCLHFNHVRY
jgi:hypothetical protein